MQDNSAKNSKMPVSGEESSASEPSQRDIENLPKARASIQKLYETACLIDVDMPQSTEDCWDYALGQLNAKFAAEAKAGFALLVLKERVPHGKFGAALEERGVSQRTAQSSMAIARGLAAMPPEKARALAGLGRTKLTALARIPYDKLEELAEKGELGGIKLEEISYITTREFQTKVRELLGQLEEEKRVSGEQLREKDQKINELERKNRSKLTPDEKQLELAKVERDLAQEMGQCVIGCRSGLAELSDLLAATRPARTASPALQKETRIQITLFYQHFQDVLEQHGIDPITEYLEMAASQDDSALEGEFIEHGVVRDAELC